MKNNNLLSIGKLSKLTNVHIQSLRYYEKIGILTPKFIDPDSQYRYYSFSQLRIVEAIQYCVELGIPLKDFSSFISASGNEIDYSSLITYGQKLAYEKMDEIKDKINRFESLHLEIIHSEKCCENKLIKSNLPPKIYFLVPFKGTQAEYIFRNVVMDMLNQVHSLGWKTGYDIGIIAKFHDHSYKQFACTDILEADNDIYSHPHTLYLPAGNYQCIKRMESDISNAPTIFQKVFSTKGEKIVIETDLFTGNYAYRSPVYELRCFLDEIPNCRLKSDSVSSNEKN